MTNTDIEKRKAPRVKEILPVKIREGDETLVVETRDISASGVYCITQKPMPLMSKVALTMLLPSSGKKTCCVDCGGTVVRVHPAVRDDKNVFEVAVFFDDITEPAKAAIGKFVKAVISGAKAAK